MDKCQIIFAHSSPLSIISINHLDATVIDKRVDLIDSVSQLPEWVSGQIKHLHLQILVFLLSAAELRLISSQISTALLQFLEHGSFCTILRISLNPCGPPHDKWSQTRLTSYKSPSFYQACSCCIFTFDRGYFMQTKLRILNPNWSTFNLLIKFHQISNPQHKFRSEKFQQHHLFTQNTISNFGHFAIILHSTCFTVNDF
jgi:hypothetical protein